MLDYQTEAYRKSLDLIQSGHRHIGINAMLGAGGMDVLEKLIMSQGVKILLTKNVGRKMNTLVISPALSVGKTMMRSIGIDEKAVAHAAPHVPFRDTRGFDAKQWDMIVLNQCDPHGVAAVLQEQQKKGYDFSNSLFLTFASRVNSTDPNDLIRVEVFKTPAL